MRRYETTGRDSWHARSGYQHSLRNPAPIEPMDGELSGKFNSPALKFVGSALVIGLAVGSWALVFAFVGGK